LISVILLIATLGLVIYGIRHHGLTALDFHTRRRRRHLMLVVGLGVFLALSLMNRSGLLLPLLAGTLVMLVRLAPVLLRFMREMPAEERSEAEPDRPASRSGVMTEAEALEILGLEPGCSRQSVQDAHRRLIQKMHPDRGGSDYLAAKINQARDILLRNR